MHMADALVSPAVGAVMLGVSVGAVGYTIRKVQQNFSERAVPLMAVMGAFVFAAQMVNFAIPGTGSSGHISGSVLLAAILGPYAAFLALSCVLILQALFFADGGLLALGCNIFNMPFIGCLVTFPLIFRPLLKRGYTRPKLILAAVATCVVSSQLGAFGVVLETLVSGITELPFDTFLFFMQPVHLVIGVAEGFLTALVLVVVWQVEPDLFRLRADKVASGALMVFLCITTVIIGGGVSLLASGYPDGLEWSVEQTVGAKELKANGTAHDVTANLQAKTALLSDYSLPATSNELLGTSLSGLAGSLITVIALFCLGFIIRKQKLRDESG